MNALRFLTLVELLVDPQDRDHTQPDITRIGGADGGEAAKFDQPGQHFTQDGIAKMADMERVMGVHVGVLDHHTLGLWRSATEVICLG